MPVRPMPFVIRCSPQLHLLLVAFGSQLFVGMILILIFAEVLGLYGLIVALILNTQGGTNVDCHSTCYNPCSSDKKCGKD